MSELQVRRVRFDFSDADVPFNWNPERPAFAVQCNLVSFFAPGFEKFIVDATREAIPLMRNPTDAEEAELYLRQEAQHSAAHRSHIRALIRRWPGLQETVDDVIASYDRLTATKPLEWRLAYPAIVEATFTPYFKVFLDHEDKLFRPGDERVSSLFIWHFVEEMEHRSSALVVYNAVHNDYRYRAKTIPSVVCHLNEIMRIVIRGFKEHVPAEDGGDIAALLPEGLSLKTIRESRQVAKRLQGPGQATYDGVPKRELVDMIVGLVRSQGPRFDPADERLPVLAERWFERYDEDSNSAARWYSVGRSGSTR